MKGANPEHQLEFLLAFDGRIHHLEAGYWLKFRIKRIEADERRPHGLSYSFTLHEPSGKRVVGFDNAHGVTGTGPRFGKRPEARDHWHRTEDDPGRPYRFIDAETLVDDFFAEVERTLRERGIGTTVIAVEENDS